MPELDANPREAHASAASPADVVARAGRLTSSLAHDVGGSLQLISGYADLLAESQMTPQQKRQVEHIRSAAQELVETVHAYRARLKALQEP